MGYEEDKNEKYFMKNARALAYMNFFLYLCSRFCETVHEKLLNP